MTAPVLYVISCAAGPASELTKLVHEAVETGWDVCVIGTPTAVEGGFLDEEKLAELTGRPVRSSWRRSGEEKSNPKADAVLCAPMTMNTANKLAAGISDTYALGLITEMVGVGVPVVALPFWSTALDAHPSTRRSVGVLREWGVRVLYGKGEWEPHEPGTGGEQLSNYPWSYALRIASELAR
ncbi:flavoprotein [Streptomyces sp. NPDC087440]|uniref:flavoprotein n=1 Tax=Streptomyces sp. NPDC087440 TaxID=3365790 RepID=UPI00380EC419